MSSLPDAATNSNAAEPAAAVDLRRLDDEQYEEGIQAWSTRYLAGWRTQPSMLRLHC
jgi:hypothetical protein